MTYSSKVEVIFFRVELIYAMHDEDEKNQLRNTVQHTNVRQACLKRKFMIKTREDFRKTYPE